VLDLEQPPALLLEHRRERLDDRDASRIVRLSSPSRSFAKPSA
jgi:hypothetical protein